MNLIFKRKSEEDDYKCISDFFEDGETGRVRNYKQATAEFSLNAVCPRYLDNWSFDINYRLEDAKIILTCIHEIIHFLWFEKWKSVFVDSNIIEFNAPYLPWLFSEIAIDSIIKETELNKYCHIEKPAYNYFYDIEYKNENMILYFRNLYNNNNISEFMIKGFDFIKKNEPFFSNIPL